jgi:hypothetical protein
VRNKVQLKLLSLAMGHASTTMTEKYVLESGLSDDVRLAAVQAMYGETAVVKEDQPAVRVVSSIPPPPPIDKFPSATEHLPKSFSNQRPRPNVKADLAHLPMPEVKLSELGEQSVDVMLKFMMLKMSARTPMNRPPTSSTTELHPAHDECYKAWQWAVEQNPELAGATDKTIFLWLREHKECPWRIPKIIETCRRYLSAARMFHKTSKHAMPRRPADGSGGETASPS